MLQLPMRTPVEYEDNLTETPTPEAPALKAGVKASQ